MKETPIDDRFIGKLSQAERHGLKKLCLKYRDGGG